MAPTYNSSLGREWRARPLVPRRALASAVAAVLLAVAACETSGPTVPPGPHMIILFGYFGDSTGALEFVARASRPGLLDNVRAELALPVDQRRLPSGPVRPAAAGENLGWRWSFVFDEWHLTDVAAEACDATPQHVHDHLSEWLSTVGQYCPWSAFVKDTAWVP